MTGQVVLGLAPAALAGGALGWCLVPWAADALLKRAYGRATSWWWQSFEGYRSFKRSFPDRPLSSTARGEEGAVALWLEDALRAARSGCLARERVQALKDEGLEVAPASAARTEREQEKRCSFPVTLPKRAALALVGAASGAAIALAGLPVVPSACLAVCAFFMLSAVACDLRARMLPLECCIALAVAGAAFQASWAGFASMGAGCAFGAVVVAVCFAVNRWWGVRGPAPIGHGDVRCMASLSLATGAAAPVGLAACYAGAGVVAAVGLATRRLSLRDGIPMAPFLALWLIGGVCVAVCM